MCLGTMGILWSVSISQVRSPGNLLNSWEDRRFRIYDSHRNFIGIYYYDRKTDKVPP